MAKTKNILFLNSIGPEWNERSALNISCIPLIKTTALPYKQALLNTDIPWVFSSKTAVQHLNTQAFPNRIYAIGERTAEQLPYAILAAETNAKSLAKQIIANKEKEVLFICGNQRRDELPSLLKEAGIIIHELHVYQTDILQKNVDLKDIDGLAFMSPSAVKGMALNGGFSGLSCFAIGPTTAEALQNLKQKTICSPKSNIENLIQTAEQYFEDNDR